MPNAKASPGSTVLSAKSWCLMVKSPMDMMSFEMTPSREPEPYWILNSVPLALYEEDFSASYFVWRKQAIEEQRVEGTQRLDEPVSRMTLNVWGGEPRVISEKYWALR